MHSIVLANRLITRPAHLHPSSPCCRGICHLFLYLFKWQYIECFKFLLFVSSTQCYAEIFFCVTLLSGLYSSLNFLSSFLFHVIWMCPKYNNRMIRFYICSTGINYEPPILYTLLKVANRFNWHISNCYVISFILLALTLITFPGNCCSLTIHFLRVFWLAYSFANSYPPGFWACRYMPLWLLLTIFVGIGFHLTPCSHWVLPLA